MHQQPPMRNLRMPPVAPPPADMDVYELITVTAELMAVLEREIEFLKKMQINEVGKLQEEKQALTKRMEQFRAVIAARPELIRALDEASRDELAEITEAFHYVLAENLRRTAVARAVNQRVVQAITEVVTEKQHVGTYTKYGTSAAPSDLSVSFNLNQQA